jgi:hypothetical protein
MPRCPVCDSVRIIIIVNLERRAFCPECGSRWKQEGSHQWKVRRGDNSRLKPTLSADVSGGALQP